MRSYLFSLYSIILPLWLNETRLERLSKVVQQVWNCSNINSYQDILNIHETTSIFVMTVIFLLYGVICASWVNETGLGRLSKVVQQLWNCSNINSYQDVLNIHETTSIFVMTVIFLLHGVICASWVNETGLGRLSKVVQQVWNCSNINSHQDILNIHETTSIFVMTVIFLLHGVINASWVNETGLGILSKVVQQVWNYS